MGYETFNLIVLCDFKFASLQGVKNQGFWAQVVETILAQIRQWKAERLDMGDISEM